MDGDIPKEPPNTTFFSQLVEDRDVLHVWGFIVAACLVNTLNIPDIKLKLWSCFHLGITYATCLPPLSLTFSSIKLI